MRKPGVASRASFEDMEEGMPVLSDPKQEEQDSQIQVCISPSSVDTSCSRAHSQDDWSSTMLKSGVAPLASLKDLEEEVPMLPDPNSGEQKMEHYLSSASIYESASELNSQNDRDQHPLEAVDDNALTRDQVAEAEAQQSVHPSSNSGKDCFISTLDMLKKLLEETKGILVREEPRRVVKLLLELLIQLEKAVENPSTMIKDLIAEEKLKHLMELWDGMFPVYRVYMRIYIFVILSQLQRATMTMRRPEEGPSPTNQVGNIVQKLLELVMTKRFGRS